MTLRNKTLIIIGLVLSCLIVLLYFISSIIILDRFKILEEKKMKQDIERSVEAYRNELNNLDRSLVDWAAWDETYRFMEDMNKDYINANLVDEPLIALKLNFIFFCDLSNKIIISRAIDLKKQEKTSVPLSVQQDICNNLLPKGKVKSILLIKDLPPLLIVSQPILTSKRKGPSRGTLVMARYLGDTEITDLSGIVHLPLKFYLIDNSLPSDLVKILPLIHINDIFVQTKGEDVISGYTLIGDIHNKPALLLEIDNVRDIYKEGKSALQYLLISLVLFAVVFIFTTIFILEKLVLSPLGSLSENVISIGEMKDLSRRVKVTGKDELSRLADEINKMLSVMEKSESELRDSKEIAESAVKVKNEFLANISHEIRTPMNAILGFSELLESQIDHENHRESLHAITAAGKNLMALINDILDLSRIEAGKLTLTCNPANLSFIFNDIKNIFSQKIKEKGLDFKIELSPSLPAGLILDELRLRQILFNLVGNAVKFTGEGYIKLSVNEHYREEGRNYVDLTFSVEDTGIGIEEEQKELIFEAFRKRDGQSYKYGGTGLGLAISKRLVEIMGGEFFLHSSSGKGSNFSFSLKCVKVSLIDKTPDYNIIEGDIPSLPVRPVVYETKVKIPEILNILEKEFMKDCYEIKRRFVISEIESFSKEIKELGKIYNLYILTEWGDKLSKKVENFDRKGIEKMLDSFPDLIKDIRDIGEA
jgi:signal transduction histidine kinase